jgi:hypothetical protein
MDDGRALHQDRRIAERADGLPDHLRPVVLAGHVEVHVDRGLADLGGQLAAELILDVADDDLRALGREQAGFSGALPRRATGDDGDLAVQ